MALFLHGAGAFHESEGHSSRAGACSRPLDLVHLAKQTLGDRGLEQEVLTMFANQSLLFLDRLKNAKTRSERKLAAHTIVGSARSLGVWKVADEAARLEADCVHKADCAELAKAIGEANAYIHSLLTENI